MTMPSKWTKKAEGGAVAIDRDEVRRALRIYAPAGERHLFRGLPSGRQRVLTIGDADEAIGSIEELADEQVYINLNPLVAKADRALKRTVAARRWFLVDVDPIRPKDCSSTEEEKAHAGCLAGRIVEHLEGLGWPYPMLVDSGNGWHLLYRIDLPNEAMSQQILESALDALGARFDDEHAKVDRSTHDAPRISKLPGTKARKGPDTPERPHRFARIAYEPPAMEVVPVELLEQLGKPGVHEAKKINGHSPWSARATDGKGLASYVARAIEGECGKVALAPNGERNNVLNSAAFSLGTLASWPEMAPDTARNSLLAVAIGNGLGRVESIRTIESGWTAGASQPRQRPVESVSLRVVVPDNRLVIWASQVRPKKVEWLWPNRIAVGFITIFAGRTGVGKSFVLCDFISRLSAGRELADGGNGGLVGNTLMISEDPYDYVLAPRLREMRADLDRVGFLSWEAMASYTLGDVEMLDRAYEQAGRPLLIAIDPPANFLGAKADEHKNSDVRQVLMGIVAWLNSKSAACVMITHVNKQVGKGVEAVDRIMGSVAWASTSRIAIGFAPDPKDQSRCLMAGIKNNLGPKADTLAYAIRKTEALAIVDWKGKVDTTANEAFASTASASASEAIEEWMEERFREKRRWLSEDLKDLALMNGFSYNAYKNYRKGVKKKNVHDEQGNSNWVWEAVYGWPPEKPSESSESSESVDAKPIPIREDSLSDKNSGGRKFRNSEGGELSDFRIGPKVSQVLDTSILKGELSELSDDSDGGASGPKVASEGLTAALRFLSGMLTRQPGPRDQFHEMGNALLMDSPELDEAASILNVVRTIEDGIEMWSLP